MTRRWRRRRVIPGGPSDHRPFIQTLRLSAAVWATVVTYNVAKNSGRRLQGMFDSIAANGTDVWCLQEVKRKWGPRRDPIRRLRKMGLEVVYERPEFLVAWRPDTWTYVSHYRQQTSETRYWTINFCLVVILQHNETGELHRFVCGHPPAHVQAPRHPSWPRVWEVLRDALRKFRRIAKRRPVRVKSTTVAMDLNVDRDKGWEPSTGWGFIEAGPLKLVEPPKPTRGGRKIDVLLVSEDVVVAREAA